MRAAAYLLAFLVVAVTLAGCAGTTDEPDDEADGGDDVARDVLTTYQWRTGRDAPTPRTEVAVAGLGAEIYVIGGFDEAGQAVRTVEVYNASQDRWRAAADYPILIHHTAAVAYDGAVYVFGGYTTSQFMATSLAFRYDPAQDAWASIEMLPAARGAHAGVAVDGVAFLVGGVGTDGSLMAPVHAYDFEMQTWSTRAEMPTPREHLAASSLNGTIYAAGGREGGFDTNMGTLEAYDPAADAWTTERTAMPTERGGIAGAAFVEHLVVVGGEGNQGTFGEAEAYDPARDEWVTLDPMAESRHGLGTATTLGRLYVMLGGPEPGLTVSGTVQYLGL